MQLGDRVTAVDMIGPERAEALANLEIRTVKDLLLYFPRDYLDYSKTVKIGELVENQKAPVKAKVLSVKNIFLRGKGRRTIQTVTFQDETGKLSAMWFNAPFVETALVVDTEYVFIGRLSRSPKSGKLGMISPVFEKVSEKMLHTQGIVPVYRVTKDLSPAMLRRYISNCLQALRLQSGQEDLFKDFNIPELTNEEINKALFELHFPETYESLKAAKDIIGVVELLPISTKLYLQAQIRAKQEAKLSQIKFLPDFGDFDSNFATYWSNFKFKPSPDQAQACTDIWHDYISGRPALRLVQGDVGSGKTAVAGFAIYLTLKARKSAAIMIPSVVLAEQHYQTFNKIFPGVVELVVSDAGLAKTSNSKFKLYVGTQALLHRFKELEDLHTIIVDEEHRFGVAQRDFLHTVAFAKGKLAPHYYTLTATPIPRTLAISLFGDIDLSVINSRPVQQKQRTTYNVPLHKREDSFKWIKTKIEEGNQAFWVCPLISVEKEVEGLPGIYDPNEKASVAKLAKELEVRFPHFKIAAFHGKLSSTFKTRILQDFREGKYDILVSTTVIEVGIDIPNANLIVIENAASFGLAQLHQLRGRVGRGDKPGYCLVFNTSDDPVAGTRLDIFSHSQNGLELAEYDLKTRGPGEVYGKMQAGVPNLKVASWLNTTQVQTAKDIVKSMAVNNSLSLWQKSELFQLFSLESEE